jgi:hypothetical protein
MGPCLISHGDLWQDLETYFVVVETNLVVLTSGVNLSFVDVFEGH